MYLINDLFLPKLDFLSLAGGGSPASRDGEPPSVAARARARGDARARGEARASSPPGDLRSSSAGDLAGDTSGAGDFTIFFLSSLVFFHCNSRLDS